MSFSLCKSAGRVSHSLFPLYKGLLYTFVLLVWSCLSLFVQDIMCNKTCGKDSFSQAECYIEITDLPYDVENMGS